MPYTVTIKQGGCSTSDEISLEHEDCEVRLKMPNIFTPNGDAFNPMFVPEEYNYLESGNMVIYNRWGEEIFNGDLFTGWGGRVGNSEASSGVYYFRALYTDKYGGTGQIDGPLTLTR
jgi:gliding motility-associated-like protein